MPKPNYSKQNSELHEVTTLTKIKENGNKSFEENNKEVINNSKVRRPSPNMNNKNLLMKSVAKVDNKTILGTKIPRLELFKQTKQLKKKWPRKMRKKRPTMSRMRQHLKTFNKLRLVS